MHKKRLESAEKILQGAGLKRTPGRIAILNLLISARHPLSQQEIALNLSDVNIKINGVSIYRSLDAFLTAGIVHRVESGDRIWRFAICGCDTRGHGHPHFICKQCGRVECLSDYKMPELRIKQPGYVAEEQEVNIRGRCSVCAVD